MARTQAGPGHFAPLVVILSTADFFPVHFESFWASLRARKYQKREAWRGRSALHSPNSDSGHVARRMGLFGSCAVGPEPRRAFGPRKGSEGPETGPTVAQGHGVR